tara:strand:+ start:13 stop:237 length:225 start_codon:yes stop_codon:yes gene_type:complete
MIWFMKSVFLFFLFCVSIIAAPTQKDVRDSVDKEFSNLLKLYQHLHANPEISFQEEKTGLRLGAEMRKLGFEVT